MFILKLVLKNALRHKLRTILTILGISIAVSAFGVLQTVVQMWYLGVEASAANRLISRHAVSFIFPLPYAYRDRILKVPGITNVTYANWFGGVYIDKKQFFARLAIDDETFFDVYPELIVPKDQLEAFNKERNACVIGEELARRYSLKIGDIMPMEGDIYPGRWEFVIRGIYVPRDKMTDPSNMLFHWKYLDERLREEWPQRAGDVGWYVVKITSPSEASRVADQIDQLFSNSSAETKTETERAFQQGFIASASAILKGMNFISFVIIGIIMLVLGNTMIMAARERTREYAVFKTLGFTTKHLTGFIAGESVLISVIGSAAGLALTFPLTSWFAGVLPKGWFPIFDVQTNTLVLAISSGLFVGIAAALFPLQRAIKTTIVDGLRQIG
ncbi:MAG TPA: FtsX-like permease family protein [Bacteroidota bacterium]|jgi:putative ABC transport system permease protein|nr:FtsX-like permease family protein [Bacteroidota bacterium]